MNAFQSAPFFPGKIMHIGNLPKSNDVNISALTGIFGSVTNSYKFYWMFALLDAVREKGEQPIPDA